MKRVLVVLLAGLLVGAVFLGIAAIKPSQYSATATLLLRNPTSAEALFGSGAPATAQNIERELATNEELVELGSVAVRTAKRTKGASAAEIEDMVSIGKGSEADLVSIEATADDPAAARRIANTYARQYIAFRVALNESKLLEARTIAERELDEMSQVERESEAGKQLHTTAAKLAALGTMQTGGAAVIEPASLPQSASSPQPAREAAIGFAIGLLAGLALVAFSARASRVAPLLALVAGVALLLPAAAQGGLRTGFAEPELAAEAESVRNTWAQRAVDSSASLVRLNVSWASIAPASPPPGFDPTDPRSPGYAWKNLDAAVRTASAHGLQVLLTVQRAPAWAEGPGRPAQIKAGVWKPDPDAYGAFAEALATRYDGSFPDPLAAGSSLPRVRYFDAWNEPNLINFLAPQVEAGKLVGPAMYRKLLNRFYAGVKEAQPGATVLGSSSASFGVPNGVSTAPVLFLRELLCLRGARLRPVSCPEKAHMDELSAHAIQVGPPTQSALSPLDATTPDLGRLTAVLRAAEAARTVRSRGHIGLWVTEFWVDSSPPDPQGIPLAQQARWYALNLYEYWQAGAEVAIELLLRDQAPGNEGFPLTIQSGIYFLDGQPKPSQAAMRFPFVAQRRAGGRVSTWGIAPRAGTVRIQALRAGVWRTLGRVRAGGLGRPFTADVQAAGSGKLRAVVGGERSLPWKLG